MESISLNTQKLVSLPKITWMESLAKRFVLKFLSGLKKGHLVLEDQGQVFVFGQTLKEADIVAHIHVEDASAYIDLLLHGTVGSGEAYIRKSWTTPDLVNVIRFFVINIDEMNAMDNNRPWIMRAVTALGHQLSPNTKEGSKKNIAAHYDLGNDFFNVFLDPTMMYSAAIFDNKSDSLEVASLNKLEIICRKLQLKPEDHLLEIGTGWGGMAIYAASNYGCKVTTTTISMQQYRHTLKRVEEAGLSEKITVLLQDYRDLTGKYDKLVSIEMIEAVGHEFYATYFAKCSSLLKDHGLMLIQAITIPDQRFEYAKNSVDFIKKYIFPGGCLPSIQEISRCLSKYTDMLMVHMEDIGEHYADTLAIWADRFNKNVDSVKAQGFDEQFCRMWEFYLNYCEGGFRERVIGTGQFLFAKPAVRSL